MRFFRPVPRVSPAGPADASPLAALLARCGQPAAEGDVASWLTGGFEVYKAVHEGRLVGMVRCAFPTGACVIDQLAVDPEVRGRGFGEYLAEHAVSRARRAGAPRAWMQLPSEAAPALAMLRKLGFRETARVGRPESPVLLLEMSL